MTHESDETEGPVIDPIAASILDTLADGSALTVEQMAKVIAEQRKRPKDGPQLWRKYMQAVKQQSMHLGKTGKIEIVHKGEVVDPDNFKGRVHLRLKK
ncbi:DUF3253 domain-containing protein [Terasakiella sp. A23]|uniref:DUF3253 domain-containing protein n=1 Tax=Terasakiella sp. FCG-A23 TaxID=3080561 RepID=UPI002952B823|nr:DUF3253 domain-containing protein [Terasakiella sp. A23]MDV7341122.1 DUF3253 domain-containing protein [Terasakiella sp. A23]